MKEELLEARKEEERLKLEVRRLEEEVLRLQTEKTSIGKLVKVSYICLFSAEITDELCFLGLSY